MVDIRASTRRSPPSARPDTRLSLIVLYLFTGVALLGYATFGRNPGLLTRLPALAPFYAGTFEFFARAHVALSGAVLALRLTRRAGASWLPAFAAVYLLTLGVELGGTGAGVPFGRYRYTAALGARWFGRVPWLIPASWFVMAVPSYALARRRFPRRRDALRRILAASLVLLVWDLALDPAMSRATAYWVWADAGRYYGMPWTNLAGWYLTGIALMSVLALLRCDRWIARVRTRWYAAFYGANLLLPLGLAAAAGLWAAVAATGAGAALCACMLRDRAAGAFRRATAPAPEGGTP